MEAQNIELKTVYNPHFMRTIIHTSKLTNPLYVDLVFVARQSSRYNKNKERKAFDDILLLLYFRKPQLK